MEYLPAFTINFGQMYVDVPYMEHMGYIILGFVLVVSLLCVFSCHVSRFVQHADFEREILIETFRGNLGKWLVLANFQSYKLLMAEILHQLIGSLSHYLQGFIHPGWCRISAINRMSNQNQVLKYTDRGELWF